MKYICTMRDRRTYRLFADHDTHAEVAEEMGGTILSAGFVRFDQRGRPHAYGESTSLGIASDPAIDTAWLRLIWGKNDGEL